MSIGPATNSLFLAMIFGLLPVALLPLAHSCQTDEQTEALRSLKAVDVSEITDGGTVIGFNFLFSKATIEHVRLIRHFPDVREIEFRQCDLTSEWIAAIGELEHLETVCLCLCKEFDNDDLVELCKHVGLRNLDLSCTAVTNLQPLRSLTMLERLDLQHCSIADDQMEAISTLDSLVELQLGSTELTDAATPWLARIKNIQELYVPETRITDVGVPNLYEMKSLRQLGLAYSVGNGFDPGNCYVSGTGIAKLKKELPLLEVFGEPALSAIGNVDIEFHGEEPPQRTSFEGLLDIADKNSVRKIDCSFTILDDESMRELARFPNVESLILRGTWITDESMSSVCKLTRLTELDLSETRITDEGIRRLASCKRLRKLVLYCTCVNGTGFDALRYLETLDQVNLKYYSGGRWSGRHRSFPGLTDEGIQAISKLEGLRELDLGNVKGNPLVTESGLRALCALKKARRIGLIGYERSDELIEFLTRELPNTKFERRFGFSGGVF